MSSEMETIWKQLENRAIEEPFQITICNKLTAAKETVLVYKNNTIEQIIREYGMCIGFSREKCERYRNGETLEQCGYGPNTTLYFSP